MPCFGRALVRCNKTDDLFGCVHAGIRPAGCGKLHRIGLHASQRVFDGILNGQTIGLGLKTLEGIPRVGDAQRQSMAQDARLSSNDRASACCA